MKQLRQAATRERRAPLYWWFLIMMLTGGALVFMVRPHSPDFAVLLAILLVAAWVAPLVALKSLSAPPRAKEPAPKPGEGTYDEWLKQARLLGRLLLYYEDLPHIPGELRLFIHAARKDLLDTLRAHPLRDDLERICQRIRDGAVKEMKDWFGREQCSDIRELTNECEQAAVAGLDDDGQLRALQAAVEEAAVQMSQKCMPRILERERLACAVDCAWLAGQATVGRDGRVSPVGLVEMLVIEWSDFSEPWQPARALRNALQRLEGKVPPTGPVPEAADEANGTIAVNGKIYRRKRVRVRVGRRHRPRHHSHRGPSILGIFLSFGQWIRYSVRSWMLYR